MKKFFKRYSEMSPSEQVLTAAVAMYAVGYLIRAIKK